MNKKKVLLAILSSNQELYKANTEALKDSYRRMLDTFNLNAIDVDVMSFVGSEKTERIGDTLYAGCLDSDIYTKNRIFMEYLLQHPEYNIIIRTNATTLVNLSYLNALIKIGHPKKNTFYGISMMLFNAYRHPFIPGMFYMATGEDFREKLCNLKRYDEIYEKLKPSLVKEFGTPSESDQIWRGVPDDIIWGEMLYDYNGVELITPDFENRFVIHQLLGGEITLDGVYGDKLCINIKFGILPAEERIKIEPLLITIMAKTMIEKPVKEIMFFPHRYYVISKQ